MHELDFRLLIESPPGLFLVLSPNAPEFTILGASDAYLGATLTPHSDIEGGGLFEAFPDNPDDRVEDVTECVLQGREVKSMELEILSRRRALDARTARASEGSFLESAQRGRLVGLSLTNSHE